MIWFQIRWTSAEAELQGHPKLALRRQRYGLTCANWHVLPVLALSGHTVYIAFIINFIITSRDPASPRRNSVPVAQLRQADTCDVAMPDLCGFGALFSLFLLFYLSIQGDEPLLN